MKNVVSRCVGGGAALLFLLLLSVPMTGGARADSPSFLALGAGYYDPFKGSGPAGELRVEYRDGTRFWLFKPFIGTTFTTDPAFLETRGTPPAHHQSSAPKASAGKAAQHRRRRVWKHSSSS